MQLSSLVRRKVHKHPQCNRPIPTLHLRYEVSHGSQHEVDKFVDVLWNSLDMAAVVVVA